MQQTKANNIKNYKGFRLEKKDFFSENKKSFISVNGELLPITTFAQAKKYIDKIIK